MKEMYESPHIEVIEVEIEKGFATTGHGTTEDPFISDGEWD